MKFGLLGSITYDEISLSTGDSFTGIGGVLYPAAVLSGLGQEVAIQAWLAEEYAPLVHDVTAEWKGFDRSGLLPYQGNGNRVVLHYPEEGEREEVLKSCVPPLRPDELDRIHGQLDMLIFTANSGMDMDRSDWRRLVRECGCPVWLDIHSLVLTPVVGEPRHYRPFPEWRDWAEDVDCLQANLKEVACMLGEPERDPVRKDLLYFGKAAREMGAEEIFITLGKKGVFVMTEDRAELISSSAEDRVVDTTGCGDVFCAGTAAARAHGRNPLDSARFGVELAFRAAGVQGVRATHTMVRKSGMYP